MTKLAMTFFLACIGVMGCTNEPKPDSTSDTDALEADGWHAETAAEVASRAPATTDVTSEATAALTGSVSPRTNCSIVQFCDAPGADGTRCLQQGCTLDQAAAECDREVPQICGTGKCPWILVTTDGRRFVKDTCP
jgi:hypothetical protein